MYIHDLGNSETGETYKELNAKKKHNIPIGSLVESIHTGVRLFVVYHNRDCDMTPLYSLAVDKENTVQDIPGFGNPKWDNGNHEDSLRIIKDAN